MTFSSKQMELATGAVCTINGQAVETVKEYNYLGTIDLVSVLLDGGDASLLLLGHGDKLGMGHEAVDGATGLWALQPLIQGATERVHHLNLKRKQKTERQKMSSSVSTDSIFITV